MKKKRGENRNGPHHSTRIYKEAKTQVMARYTYDEQDSLSLMAMPTIMDHDS